MAEKGSQRKSFFLEGSVQGKEKPELSLETQTNQEGFIGRVTLQFIFQTGVCGPGKETINKDTGIAGRSCSSPVRYTVTLLTGLRDLQVIHKAVNKEPRKVFNLESDVVKVGFVKDQKGCMKTQIRAVPGTQA